MYLLGIVCAVDLLEINPIKGVHIMRGDFRDPQTQALFMQATEGKRANVVLSDMLHNTMGT